MGFLFCLKSRKMKQTKRNEKTKMTKSFIFWGNKPSGIVVGVGEGKKEKKKGCCLKRRLVR